MKNILEGKLSAKDFKFAIVVSRFNDFISQKLVEGAIDCLERHHAEEKNESARIRPSRPGRARGIKGRRIARSGRKNRASARGAQEDYPGL